MWARGGSSRELLEGLGLGLFSIITDLRRVRPLEERTVSASGEEVPALVVAYLGELLLLQQTEGFLVREITARPVGSPPTAVLAVVRGEPFDETRHTRRKEVKAVTFHQLEFDPSAGRARVILDI
ncbi:MAG: archease [Thermoplasmata archaeon]|nr:archease [Thermoplasmata archaeon]